MQAGSTSPDLVAIEARKAEKAHNDARPLLDDADCDELGIGTVIMPAITDDTPEHRPAARAGADVITLRPRQADQPDRPLPSLAIYDRLLTRRQNGTSA